MSTINDDTATPGTHMPSDAIIVPLRDDTTQEQSSSATPSTMRSRERRRRKARGSFYSRRRRSSGSSGSANRRGSGTTSDRRGSGASNAGESDTTRSAARRNRKFASRLGRSRSSFVDRINSAVAELLNLNGGFDDDDDEGDKAAGTGAPTTSTRRIRRARNPSATGGGPHRRKFGSLLGRSRISYEERLDVAVEQSIRQLQVENINFDDDEEDGDNHTNTKIIEGDRAAGAAEVGKNEDENRISTATTIRVEDSDEE